MKKINLTSKQAVPSATSNLAIIVAIGVAFGLLFGLRLGWAFAPLVTWVVAGLIYVTGTWRRLATFNAALVRKHALREDPSRVTADAILLAASLASLSGVVLVLISSQSEPAIRIASAALTVLSVVISWLIIHTVYALKYAELYYSSEPAGGIDFGDTTSPVYLDFAYVALTLGMTYQVSDTNLKTRAFRSASLKHALLSYLFGTIIIATTINLVAGLTK